MSAAVAADLRAVRERLVTFGWAQGAHRIWTRCCLLGAMEEVGLYGTATALPRRALWEHIPDGEEISVWNDAPGRTFADVLALLDKAIAAEEARP